MDKVIYVAEFDNDIDDVIAAEYLYRKNALEAVVCDPRPKTPDGQARAQALRELGVPVLWKMPPKAACVFIGGALTAVARHAVNHKIKCLVMNGGFAGDNIATEPLKKFQGKTAVRTFNFNVDVQAADRVLKSPNIGEITLIGKNVCHHPRNTFQDIWSGERGLIKKYRVSPTKRLHDLLACREGLVHIGLLEEPPWLEYRDAYPFNTGLKGNMTQWGTRMEPSGYSSVRVATGWKPGIW